MRAFSRHRVLSALFATGIATAAHGLGQLQVENAAVGQRILILTIDDSVQTPDLSKIRVEGYEIENAMFVEESGLPSRFAPTYVDLTAPGKGQVIEYAPGPGSMIVEMPMGIVPQIGTIFGDTAFGGLLRKVVEVDPQAQPGVTGRRWLLKTIEAELPEAVLDLDITFKTRLDMNQSLSDLVQAHDVAGTSLARGTQGEGVAAFGRLDLAVKGAQILFQPVVSGRLQVRNGKVEVFTFNVSGDCEVGGEFKATLAGAGEYEFEEELPGKAPQILSLGSGLFVRMQNRPFLKVEASSAGQNFGAHADMRIRNSIRGELGFRDGQWRPLAENKMAWSSKSVHALWGDGSMRIALKPRVEMLLEGMHGPVFTFEPYARFASSPAMPLPGWVPPASPEAFGPMALRTFVSPAGEPRTYGAGNKELGLGANIFMESRTTFAGPTSLRSFLLFSREQTVLSPPREGTLSFKEADSNRLALQCQTYPKSEYFIIQQKLGNGPWETALDKASVPRIHLAGLKPSTLYRFRAIGVNAMGVGPAFPPEGLAFTTPAANRAPFLAVAFPDSGAVLPDSLPVGLAWKGGDLDAGAKVEYSLYLDTRFPPLALKASGFDDTALVLNDLKPGVTYWWKVVASDGIDRTEGPVRSFTLAAPPAPVVQPAKGYPEYYPLVFVPKGSFRREDGRTIQVGPVFLGKYEVTQAEFQKHTGRNPSYRLQDSLPVDRVTWEEAETFCRETGGRLPTEAEWEYAARAGSGSSFYWGAENPRDYAWYRDNSDNRTQKVGLKKANAWGLHDMAGNVFEWVQDWHGEYSAIDLDHPKGPATGTAKVTRGASWYSESGSLSLTTRYNNRPGFRNFKVGFRCARDPERSAGGAWADPAGSLAGKSADPITRLDVSPAK